MFIFLKSDCSVMKTIVFQNDSFIKLVVLLTIVNDDPLLTKRVNRPEGHLYLSLTSF